MAGDVTMRELTPFRFSSFSHLAAKALQERLRTHDLLLPIAYLATCVHSQKRLDAAPHDAIFLEGYNRAHSACDIYHRMEEQQDVDPSAADSGNAANQACTRVRDGRFPGWFTRTRCMAHTNYIPDPDRSPEV